MFLLVLRVWSDIDLHRYFLSVRIPIESVLGALEVLL